jgi:hypothetical protein
MKTTINKKNFTVIIVLLSFFAKIQAQTPDMIIDSVKKEIFKINKVFNTAQYLSFNMDIIYKSDTLGGINEQDAMSGNYVLNEHNMYYKMGNQEMVQTDSFLISIYHDEKTMIMTKSQEGENSQLFPLKVFTDSMIEAIAVNYNISIFYTTDSLKCISFQANSQITTSDIGMPYLHFSILYNDESYYTDNFAFEYQEQVPQDLDDSIGSFVPAPLLSTKKVQMSFTNYSVNPDLSIFELGTYVLFNNQRKTYEMVNKYKDYEFMSSGFENRDEALMNYRELNDENNP